MGGSAHEPAGIGVNTAMLNEMSAILDALPRDLVDVASLVRVAMGQLTDATSDPHLIAAAADFDARWISALRLLAEGAEDVSASLKKASARFSAADRNAARRLQGTG